MCEDQSPNPEVQLGSIREDFASHERELAARNEQNKAVILEALKAAGVASVLVVFDGSGDSGAVEDVDATDAARQPIELPPVKVSLEEVAFGVGPLEPLDLPLKQAVAALALSYLAQTHAGWENNEGGFGEVRFDVAADAVTLDYSERRTETDDYSHTF